MVLQFYAGLKDYFPPQLEIENSFSSVSELKSFLKIQKPEASKLLEASRFASGSEILISEIPSSHELIIAVLPPSSGG